MKQVEDRSINSILDHQTLTSDEKFRLLKNYQLILREISYKHLADLSEVGKVAKEMFPDADQTSKSYQHQFMMGSQKIIDSVHQYAAHQTHNLFRTHPQRFL